MAKRRKRTKNSGTERTVKAVIIIAVILCLLFIAAVRLGHVTYSGIGDGINEFVNKSAAGSGYPYQINSGEVKMIKAGSSNIDILYDTGLRVLSSSAKEISDLQHNYSSPALFSFASRCLVTDIGFNKYRIQTPSKLSFEGETEFEILTADISKNGFAALVTKCDKGTSMLTVYNSKQDVVFSWICAKEQIVCVDLSDNGRYICLGTIGADSGDVYSQVHLFDINYSDPIASFDLNGTSVVSTQMLSGKKFLIVGDNLLSFVNSKGEKNDIDVSLNSVSRYFVSENNTVTVLLSKYKSAYSKILKVYNSSGKELSSTDVECSVKSISSDGRYVALLSDGKLLTYTLRGKLVGEKNIENDAVSCCVSAGNVYVLFSNYIDKFTASGNNLSAEDQMLTSLKADEEVTSEEASSD